MPEVVGWWCRAGKGDIETEPPGHSADDTAPEAAMMSVMGDGANEIDQHHKPMVLVGLEATLREQRLSGG
jgi:hypothetical protein